SRVVEVASLVPADQEHKIDLLRDIQHRLRSLPQRDGTIPRLTPEPQRLHDQIGALLSVLQTSAQRDDSGQFDELGRSLAVFRDQLATGSPGAAGSRLRDFEQRMTGDLASDLHRLRDVATPAAITLGDLPPSLVTRYIGRSGRWLLRVFAKDCL